MWEAASGGAALKTVGDAATSFTRPGTIPAKRFPRVTHLLPFLGGLAGSVHCVGMCGAFPLALGGHPAARWRRQLLYNLGRVNTLVFIGAVSGAAGAALVASGPVALAERALAVVAGGLMILVGLEMLLPFTLVTRAGAALARRTVGRGLAAVMRSRSAAAPLALGVFNAFLPCQLIYAFAAQAAGTASVAAGMTTMLAFGLGTVPAMLAVGAAPAFATLTVLRGLALLPSALHPGHGAHADCLADPTTSGRGAG
jgi:sulfite exporter TauE/SafE